MHERLQELAARLPQSPAQHSEREAAVAIVLRSDEVLLMRRVERAGDRWSGQVSLPGGHRDARDADLLATAVREAEEEVLIDLRRDARFLGCMPAMQARAGGARLDMWITPFLFEETRALDPRPSPEAAQTFWLPLGLAQSGELDARHQWTGDDGLRRQLPSWRYAEHVIWGMTHHMLGQLIQELYAG